MYMKKMVYQKPRYDLSTKTGSRKKHAYLFREKSKISTTSKPEVNHGTTTLTTVASGPKPLTQETRPYRALGGQENR